MKKINILLLLIVAASCQYFEPKLSILDNPVCEPPCWQNVIPGKTEKGELLNILTSLPFVDEDSISNVNIPGSAFMGTLYASLYGDEPYQTQFYADFLDDKVTTISMEGDWHITLAETIEKLGQPRTVIVIRYRGDIFVTLINPEKGVSFGYNSVWKEEKWRNKISSDIEIESLLFFDPSSYEMLMSSGIFSWWLLNSEETASALYTWDGYGSLDEKYPPR